MEDDGQLFLTISQQQKHTKQLRRAIITRYCIQCIRKKKKIQETYFQESVLHNRLTQ